MLDRFEHKRLKDWNVRWIEFIADSMDIASDLQLDWDSEGVTCYSWVGDGVAAITGHNPHDQFIGQYDSILSACRLIKSHGYSSLNEAITSQFSEVPVGQAQTGDIALVNTVPWSDAESEGIMPHGLALVDPPFYYAVTEQGLVKGELYTHGVRAFAVGRKV